METAIFKDRDAFMTLSENYDHSATGHRLSGVIFISE